MKKIQISPSILGVKKDHLSFVCNQLLSANSDLIHFDVMDGIFVDNKSFVEDEIGLVSSIVNHKIIDVHLMCKNLKYYIPQYANEKVKYISIHYEAVDSLSLIYNSDIIRSLNIHPGIVINPETDVKEIIPLLNYFDLVLVMSVHPGLGGQVFIESSFDKIKFLDDYRKENNLKFVIEVDGGINAETSKKCIENGADILVSGSYIIKSDDYLKQIESLK